MPYSRDQIHSGESGNVGPNSKYFLLVPPWRAPVIASARTVGSHFFSNAKAQKEGKPRRSATARGFPQTG